MILEAREEARPILEAWIAAHGTLHEAAALHPGAGKLQGRGRVFVVSPDAVGEADRPPVLRRGRWVVRHYQRGGAVASALGDRYFRAGMPRPLREYRLLRTLEARGIPVPRAIGAAVYPAGAFYRGDLVTEWVHDSTDLAAVLFHPEPPVAAAFDPIGASEAAGQLVRSLHAVGLIHPDLNLKNILVTAGDAGPRAVVIDLDRARLGGSVSRPARRRMLRRFERSLRKWEVATGRRAPAGSLAAFRRGYAAGAEPSA